MNIKTINIKNSKKYNGKSFSKDGLLYIYCGRPSKLSNPYEIGKDGNREDVIEKFKILSEPLFGDTPSILQENISDFIEYLKKVNPREVILGCHCKPLSCHCDVIEKLVDNEFNKRLF